MTGLPLQKSQVHIVADCFHEKKKNVLHVKLLIKITNLNESSQILHNAMDTIQFTQTGESRLDFGIHSGLDNCLHKVFCYKGMAMGLKKKKMY